MVYQWQKGFWSRPSRIIHNGAEVGRLAYDSAFGFRATGELDGRTFRFRTTGRWKSAVLITDDDDHTHEVRLGIWRWVGRLGGGLEWSTNFWNSKWEWKDHTGDPVVRAANDNLSGTRGTITLSGDGTAVDLRMLALAGLYVDTYMTEAAALVIVILLVLA